MSISDSFPYSNGALSGNSGWATTGYQGSFTVTSQQLTGANGDTRCNLRSDSWGSAQGSQIEIVTPGASMFNGVIIHGVISGGALVAGYLLSLSNSGNYDVYRYDPGSDTNIGGNATGVSAAGGDTIKIETVGTNILVYRNGVQLGSPIADNTYRAGTPGLLLYRETQDVVLDNWVGTGEAAGSSGSLISRSRSMSGGMRDMSGGMSG